MNDAIRRERALEGGLDIDAFEKFCEFASENPEDVQFELEARGIGEGRAVHTRATTGPYTLGGGRIDRLARHYTYHIGAHKEVEAALGFIAPTDRAEATEIVLAALTGCLNATVSSSALKRGLDLDYLEVNVSIPWNPFVFLHLTDPETDGHLHDQFGELKVELCVEGDNITEDDVTYLQESMKRSAVYNIFRLPHSCEPVVSLSRT